MPEYIDVDTMHDHATAALRAYERIGEGDWTPQDVAGHQCAQDLLEIVQKIALTVRDDNPIDPPDEAQLKRLLA